LAGGQGDTRLVTLDNEDAVGTTERHIKEIPVLLIGVHAKSKATGVAVRECHVDLKGEIAEISGVGDAGQEKALCAHRGMEGAAGEETTSAIVGVPNI